MCKLIFILLFSFTSLGSSASPEGDARAKQLVEELNRNIVYISEISNVNPSGVFKMLLVTHRHIKEESGSEISVLELSNKLYHSEHFYNLLTSKKASLAQILSQYGNSYNSQSR
ncbi:hypothetical protein TW85_24925 [Marinomonas sp. S3726]|uniref:hypothetical protein n=1 Tax=Marinomonas sp. S3726 TaxID=579484 RepID=UPI0005FA2D29|nr:hypothetical protein [Marinomonas sp. S3726]KJZ07035.1 hypothetical protein TW85_24925 [Marinomonas sp. S3726]